MATLEALERPAPVAAQAPVRMPHLRGLDGIRALAVASIVVYHLGRRDARRLPGRRRLLRPERLPDHHAGDLAGSLGGRCRSGLLAGRARRLLPAFAPC